MPDSALRSTRAAAAALVIGAVAASVLVAAPAQAAVADRWPLIVTEIVPDTTGGDEFEFFEVTNTTDAPIDLAAEGIGFAYYGGTSPVALTVEEPTVIPGGATTVFWLSYRNDTGTIDSFARTEDEFRASFPATQANTYDIVRVTGQAGMANGGARGIRVLDADGGTISDSFYPGGSAAENAGVTFGVPADETGVLMQPREQRVAPTPGTIDAALLQPLPPTEEPEEWSNAGAHWPLVVTEIAADNTGADNFEYFEVANTTDEPIALGAAGIRFHYIYTDSDVRDRDVVLTVPEGTVVPARGVTVFWTSTPNEAITEAQFRTFYPSLPADVEVVRATGQGAFANGGDRGVRIVDADGTAIGWSFYPAGSVSGGLGAEYRVPDVIGTPSMPLHRSLVGPTPGVVDPAVLHSALERPEDPVLVTAPLQITELLPDSTNVGSADGYEFVEVYNATNRPVDFSDYTLRYLYPLADLSNSSTALWPSTPRDAVVEPGGTLVFWIKNGANDALTAADFNARFGTDLELGVDLVEVFSGGMANGSPRGLEIITNSGVSLNRAYYNLGGVDDTVADAGIQYTANPDDTNIQTKSGISPATPGRVGDTQVPVALMPSPVDTVAPVIENRTPATFTPGAAAIDFAARVTDETLVRTVTLELSNDVDGPMGSYNLLPDEDGVFRFSLPAVDTIGKGRYDYRLTASDGDNLADTGAAAVVSDTTPAPVRLSVENGAFLSGVQDLRATGETAPPALDLLIDSTRVQTRIEVEREPVFAFEATATDAYFRNGVRMGDEVLTIFDRGVYGGVETVQSAIPLDEVEPGRPFAVRIYAGTKAAPEIDPNENNDNFSVYNMRLVLPDGRTLRAPEYTDPTKIIAMGDSGGSVDYFETTFTLPDDAFTSVAHEWDTTKVSDGSHTVSAVGAAGSSTVTVRVDNTAPAVTTDLEERLYQGEFVIDAEATDGGSGLESLTATLDGEAITLPFRTSSLQLAAAEHVAVFTATDALGNVGTREVRFTTPVEEPGNELLSPEDGAELEGDSVDLRARATDPSGDRLDVSFRRGYELTPGAGVQVSSGTATDALAVDRPEATPVTEDQARAMAAFDETIGSVESSSKLPYQLFEVAVPADAGEGAQVRIRWDGSANADAKVLMYVLDPAAGAWTEVDRHLTTGGAPTTFTLDALVAADAYARDGVVTVLVQHSEGFAGDDLSTRQTPVEPNHPEDTPRSAYDFTFAWESDTQYYNANDDIYDRQVAIHQYLLRERSDLNLQYLMHTGDIVDQSEDPAQWLRADPAYRLLDDADLPYGVLAGNHDVNQQTNDYTKYSQYFGEARYADNPWYGGTHLDNRGHYDLMTMGGLDFIVLYMGWAPGDEQIAWMNEVLAQYPERTAIVALHEFMLTTGGLGPVPQRILDEVIAVNPNVRFVSSGHYHDAYTRLFEYDDDGDGTPDRTVTAMLFDYQGLPEGGQGYLRLMHFDNVGQAITVRTFSPYEHDYDSEDPTLEQQHQEFTIPYAQAGIVPRAKTLAADAFQADVLTADVLGSFSDVESGAELETEWAAGEGTHAWYVQSTDPHGAVAYSEVRAFTLLGDDEEPGGEEPGDGAPAQPSVPVPGDQLDPAGENAIDAPDSARQGDAIAITVGTQFAGQWVQAWLHGDGPIALGGWTRVGADGRIFAVIPASAPVGDYRLAVQDADGAVIGWTPLEVLPALVAVDPTSPAAGAPVRPVGGALAATGAGDALPLALGAGMLLLGGAVLFGIRRRRES
ncbi:LPXTG-motif cell wall-anchored protein [Diaminobutyricimonas aerilata]|uniref:LPXTG-motif cell wall-anchored protein n=1 Tax=Diaminobutyricimonas aerilata TaxID=1162967 RepID=A0A2M9CNZ0_9MICO|nr:lamin tail domain-containing protein [Diaminobutyricimonas aerilata]PJJ73617.1 LPXTG-motif cell wall-anchored protein [Diaminobutyricimonas aerilata]